MKMLICIVLALLVAGCQRNPVAQPAKEYQMQGEVVALDPSAHLATIKAGKIEGWMEAMTMEYPVNDPQEFSKLKVGGKIQGKVTVQGTDYWISSVNAEPSK
jgi:Cu/Ag efflux protein CusF